VGTMSWCMVHAVHDHPVHSPTGHYALTTAPGCMQVLSRGTCSGCWNERSTLQSLCGRCRVGACQACRKQWAVQRLHGTHANDAGLLVHQANVCFCGAHLTPRGAAVYDRKVSIPTSNSHIEVWVHVESITT